MAATTIEDEMGWGKKENYCSSSSDDEAEETEERASAGYSLEKPGKSSPGPARNTGPKGVLEDWRQYKKLESERREDREKELSALAKRVSLTCRTHREDELAKKAEEEQEDNFDDDDGFLNEYAAKRMREMMQIYEAKKNPIFGSVCELVDADMFIKAIDDDSNTATVILHLYEPKVKNCDIFDRCLSALAERYTMVKCCRIRASLVGASKRLQSIGLPAVLAYREGQLIGNFVRIGDELDEDFGLENVEQYLKEFGILPDLGNWNSAWSAQRNIKRQEQKQDSDTDSD